DGDRGGGGVFRRRQIRDVGNRRQVVDRGDRQHEGVGDRVGAIVDRHRDGRGPRGVGDRRDRQGAIGAGAADDDVGVGHHRLVRGRGGHSQRGDGGFHIADRDGDRRRGGGV